MRSRGGTFSELWARLLAVLGEPRLGLRAPPAPGSQAGSLQLPSAPLIGWQLLSAWCWALAVSPPSSALWLSRYSLPLFASFSHTPAYILLGLHGYPFRPIDKVTQKAVRLMIIISTHQTKQNKNPVFLNIDGQDCDSLDQQFSAGDGKVGAEAGDGCQREWEYPSEAKEQRQPGQALMWQADNKFSYFRAKSSQPAKHSTAGSFINDP